MENGDYTLPFGAHKGKAVRDVPDEYFTAVLHVCRNEDSDFWKGQPQWVHRFAIELDSRYPDRYRDEIEDALEAIGLKWDPNATRPEQTAPGIPIEGDQPKPPPHNQFDSGAWSLPFDTVDAATKDNAVLKAFVTRARKEDGLITWMIEAAKEAAKYGSPETFPGDHTIVIYGGLRFILHKNDNANRILGIEAWNG